VSGDRPTAVKRVRPVMERQVGHMVRLIDDLLDVSRITSGKITLRRVPTPLPEIVQGAIDAQRAAIDEAGINLTVELPAVPCVVDVDPTRLVQVLSNVIHNAMKFTPAGGRIHVSADVRSYESETGELIIRVSDTGMGIMKEMLPRVFDLFTQGNRPAERQQGGLGIGLALARRLLEMHNGAIEAMSDGPGRGSTFVLTLPVSPSDARTAAAPSQASRRRISRRVLIVDDNDDAARMMAMLVEALGGSARTAADAKSGIDAIDEFHPDIVFLDIGMPGIDGYEACRRIRATKTEHRLLLVALTGWGHPDDKRRAIEVGFDAHLTKPVDPAAFEELLAVTRPEAVERRA
jgi:CheY-like chemotaxis protein